VQNLYTLRHSVRFHENVIKCGIIVITFNFLSEYRESHSCFVFVVDAFVKTPTSSFVVGLHVIVLLFSHGCNVIRAEVPETAWNATA